MGANLHDAKLVAANLQGANLEGAKLKRANLLRANLQTANLQEVNLEGTDLRGANLQNTDLRGVNGLICKDLRLGNNWQYSFRDEELACGASLPTPPHEINEKNPTTPETPSQPDETGSVTSHVTTLIQQRELTHWTAQSLADALAELTKHQDNQLDQADKEFLISLQKSLQEIAIATKKEADDKDAQIAALQKQIDEFKEQIEALKNQPDNEKTSFLKEYLPNAGESLGKATGPAFLISLTFGLSYLIGTPPNDIAELLKLLK